MNCEVACHLLHESVVLASAADDDSQRRLEEHLGGCAACRDERESLMTLSADIPAAVLAPLPADPALRTRLFEGTRHGRALPSFAGALAKLFDMPREQARALLAELEQPAAWHRGVVKGNWMRQVRTGPAAGGASAVGMLLRTTPGTILPHHGHHGAERTFVLQGGYRDSAGGEVWAGEYSDWPAGVEHELHVLPPVECVAAVLVQGGVYRVG